jgi:hypothetical protein
LTPRVHLPFIYCDDIFIYCDDIFTHAATSGLLAGTALRQVAERSLGITAAFRLGPQ